MRILLVEDDELLSQLLTEHLTSQRYVVDTATDGMMGLYYAQAAAYDLIVLDVNLPRLNGIQLCQKLREQRYTVPILLLTAKGSSSDKVMGLDAGADDYVVKPCPVEEISARVRALLRRPHITGMPILTWGNLALDPVTCEVRCSQQLLALSPKEYGLLELFLRNPQRTFSSSLILEHLWSFEDAPGEETVRSHIKRLRSKLKTAGIDDFLDTVYGMGYRLKPAPPTPVSATSTAVLESANRPSASPPSTAAQRPDRNAAEIAPPVADAARAAAIALWQEFQQPMLERVALIDQAIVALSADQLTEPIRQAAMHAAHKLAGSLAMFGFPRGSELGQVLEQELQLLLQPADAPHLQTLVTELHQVLHSSPQPPQAQGVSSATLPAQPHHWLIIDDDDQMTARLQAAGQQWGVAIASITDPAALKPHLAAGTPAVILLDSKFLSTVDLTTFQTAHPMGHQPYVVILSQQDDFPTRLAGVRGGGNHLLPKSTPPEEIIQTIQALLIAQPTQPIKVLAVDDDETILHRLQACLPAWGMELTTISQPETVWPTLEQIQPDLVILDVEMPAVSGIELCQVIRSDRTWHKLPVLFLTARREPDIVSQIYRVGADDYVSKPFTDVEIATRIINRLARNRFLQQDAAAL